MHWKEQELPFGLNTALLEFQLPLGGLGGVHLSQLFLSLSRSEQNTDVSSPAGYMNTASIGIRTEKVVTGLG